MSRLAAMLAAFSYQYIHVSPDPADPLTHEWRDGDGCAVRL